MVDSVEAIQAPKPGEAISSAPTRENPREVNPGSEESVLKSPKTPILARIVWTDELHNLYLSFMESSFLDQLYINENRSNDLLGCLHIEIRNPTTKDLALSSNFLVSCQLKVLQKGCWQTHNFDRKRIRFEIKNETWHLLENPWIQHFTSRSRRLNQMDSNELTSRARHSGRPTRPIQQHPFCPHNWHRHPRGGNAEVSDQNFVDMESEEEHRTRMARAKRAKTESSKRRSKMSHDWILSFHDLCLHLLLLLQQFLAPTPMKMDNVVSKKRSFM
ncbi:hypothetical protein C4D60_Mb05t12060 [Musa balbisiana]|uniref:Uncharacterized protein n=1 Tax=Musa balbisiana TaxID=52838 RepID=A0A4S8JVJ8_MUSBA|nr:hypothetical protein C4D60_Mb05t12060 [Musa balbisiana]